MSNIPKVSVIIPVWNPGEGIVRCVSSLRGQTLEDIELIFIDDCGTDNAMETVRTAATEDPRICILTNAENKGEGASRNAGIDAARGEYLSFVDADDYVSPDFLEMLYKKARQEDLDIVKGTMVAVQNDTVISQSYRLNEVLRSGMERNEPLFFLFSYEFSSALYHHRLFADPDVRFGLSAISADSTFLLRVLNKAAIKFGIEDKANYYYVHRMNSAINTVDACSLDARLSSLRERVLYLVKCVEPNPFAIRYFVDRLKYYLSLQLYYMWIDNGGMEDAAARFLSELRDMAAGYPGIAAAKEKDFTVLALVDYGECLPHYPYAQTLTWGKPSAKDYFEVIKKWMDFLTAHPEHYRVLPELESRERSFGRKMADNGIPTAEIEQYKKQVKALWRRLPVRVRFEFSTYPPSNYQKIVYLIIRIVDKILMHK